MKTQGNPWWSRSMGTIFPTAFVHFLSLCHSLVILTAFWTFHYVIFVMVIQMVQWVHLDHRKESACQCWRCKRRRFNLWVGKIPGGGNDNPLQYSCLGNPMDSGAWWAIIHGVAKESDTTERLSVHGDLWPLMLLLWLTEGSDDGQQFFFLKQ